jgi:hypothetical protein
MNPLSCVLSFPAAPSTGITAHGWQRELLGSRPSNPTSNEAFGYGPGVDPTNCLTWTGTCRVCGAIKKNGCGLFCSNIYLWRGNFHPCGMCGAEAVSSSLQPTHAPHSKARQKRHAMESPETPEFRTARDGNHLMGVPFECDLCHFRNVSL